MEPETESNEEVSYEDESFETFEDEPVEPMSFADEFAPAAKRPVELEVPNMPSAFTALGAMDRRNLGFP